MPDNLRDVRQQLDALRRQRTESNPELYRDLALYLQVLRDGLLNAVQQACFHLAAEVHPDRYLALPAPQRRHLHRRLRSLVGRASSLLTVEQLAGLAAQIARERIDQLQAQHQELLEQLRAEPAGEAPPGSVHLALQPPIGLALADSPLVNVMPDPAPSGREEVAPLALLEQLASPRDDGEDGDDRALPGPPPWDQAQLPRDPGALLVWLEGFERALTRRLRNLSHALNVELLRQGLASSLLPLSLLEAALQGRLELQPSAANLIRLPLAGVEAMAVLLRSTDLEQGLPALRTCRSRWRQHRLEVRRMAELSRRLQRRVQVLEAQQLWLQDLASLQPPRAEPPPTAG